MNEDFEKIAEILNRIGSKIDRHELVDRICATFGHDNDSFNEPKFRILSENDPDKKSVKHVVNDQDSPTAMMLRHMAWARAKGELESILCTFWTDSKYSETKRYIREFIYFIEQGGYCE